MSKIVSKNTRKACFVYEYAHYALLNKSDIRIGGAEMQQKILVDALTAKDWKICFVTGQIGDKKILKLSPNLTLYPVLNLTGGNKYLRKILTLPVALWKILKYIDADIYYQRNTTYLSGIVALFCKIYRKKYILAGANNWNFEKGKERNLNDPLDRLSARFAIKTAHRIIVQSEIQGEILKKNYKRNGSVFYNIYPPKPQRKNGHHVLWVGRMVKHKSPELFLELAKSFPMYNFAMVGGKGDPRLMLEIEKQAAKIENLEYLGHQSFDKVEGLFDQAAIFISTYSIATEGFPNTFLQAWSRGIPVVSSMDLDELIIENNLGIVADSASEMKKAIQSLMSDKNLKKYSSRIQDVFTRKFSVPNRIQDFERILSE